MFSREQARKLTERVLALSSADATTVHLTGGNTTHLRFARSSPSTSGVYDDPSISITCEFGKRSATASSNQFDDESLTRAVRRSEQLARVAPEDPESMPGLGPQSYSQPDAFDEATAKDGASGMARGVKVCIEHAMANRLVAAGFTQTSATFECRANTAGQFAYHRATTATVSETVRTSDGAGSGWASAVSNRIGEIDYARVAKTATSKAVASAHAKPLDPGKYVTILEPACVASLIGGLVHSMGTRTADEGRSYFSAKGGRNRLGERLFPKSIDIYSDPNDALAPSRPWGEDGLAQIRRDWVKEGTVASLSCDRFWANKTGVAPVPAPSNVIMKGGQDSLDDLIASTERGVLVTSLWYIRSLDPRTMLYTGLTRDGVFLIESGKISHPVVNFRWNDSPISVLKNVVGMSRSVRVSARGSQSATTVVPALKVKEFTFSSVSDAV